jgi:hypothetical protein
VEGADCRTILPGAVGPGFCSAKASCAYLCREKSCRVFPRSRPLGVAMLNTSTLFSGYFRISDLRRSIRWPARFGSPSSICEKIILIG